MKKALLCFVILVFVLSVMVSCSNKDTPTTPDAEPTPNATQTVEAYQTVVVSYVLVQGATFTQTDGTESFSHTISSFQIAKCEVTYDLWYLVHQWAISNGYSFANAGRAGFTGGIGAIPATEKYKPVSTINWRDIIVWCNAYSEMSSLTPVYYSDAGFITPIKDSTDGIYFDSINTTPGSFDNPYVNWSANGHRLPTEGEWEYAARYISVSSRVPHNYVAGDTQPFETSTTIGDYCWYYTGLPFYIGDAATKLPNALGIYDMSGNIRELCWDWWNSSYPGTSTDYKGTASGSYRVARGGNAANAGIDLSTGNRNNYAPYGGHEGMGFRTAKTQ